MGECLCTRKTFQLTPGGAHGIAWTWRGRTSGQRTGHQSVAGPPETRATAPPTTGTELPALPDLTLGSGPATGYAVGSPWGPRALMGTRNGRSGGRGRGFRGCAADRWINFLRKERRYDRPSLQFALLWPDTITGGPEAPPVPAQLPQQEGRRSHVCPGSHNQLACTPTALPVTQTCRAMSEAARLPPLLAVSRLSLPTHQDTDRVTLCLPRSPTQAGHPSLMLACPMRIWVNSRISMPRETIWKVQSGGETGSL